MTITPEWLLNMRRANPLLGPMFRELCDALEAAWAEIDRLKKIEERAVAMSKEDVIVPEPTEGTDREKACYATAKQIMVYVRRAAHHILGEK